MPDKPSRTETLANVRAMYPAYKDTPDLELGNALAAKYPDAYGFLKEEAPRGEGDKVTGPTTPESIQANVLNPGQPKPLDAVQKVGNAVLPPLMTAPTIAAGGEVLAGAPAVGRALASGALGGAKAASEGKGVGGIAWDTVVDTLLGGASEAAGKVAGAVKIPKLGWKTSLAEKAGKVEGAAAGRAGAGEANVKAAKEAVKNLPTGLTVNVPALGPRPMTVPVAIARLNRLDDPQHAVARQQLINALNAADKSMLGPGKNPPPYAGQIFGKFSPKERFTYHGTPAEQRLGAARDYVPGARAGLDAAATAESVAPGVPNLMLPLLGAEGASFSDLARHARPHL